MVTKIVDNLGAAIGCRFLQKRNQLAFVEYSKGTISLLDMVCPTGSVVSKGTTVLKGTWVFDCETGALGGSLNGPGDIWWEQIDNTRRQMVPVGGAGIVNLGKINFASVTPALLQTLPYNKVPIIGNNDATNQLVDGTIFAVQTKAGNFAKIMVIKYDYNMEIKWETYKPASPYHVIGTGYTTPEDIAVSADEKTAYVTERTGNLLKVDLNNANRSAATVVASGMKAPQQIHLDESHHQAYIVEYANPGCLIRIDLKTKQKTVLLNGLNNAIGLLISSDLAFAYISQQSGGGRITRYSLQGGAGVDIASGLTNPFFLTWANPMQTSMFVAERDPANRITMVDTIPYAGSIRQIITNVGVRPSSVAKLDDTNLLICCDKEVDKGDILAGVPLPAGLFKGIGLVPWNLITAGGMADTTSQPVYPYQFAKNSPFGGSLSLQVNHQLARENNVKYYRVLVDNIPRLDTCWDLHMNTVNGKFEIPVQFKPKDIGGKPGCYGIHEPGKWYMNTDLGMIMDSSSLSNDKHAFKIEFLDTAGVLLQDQSQPVLIDNNRCIASIEMPTVNNVSATTDCGMLKFANKNQKVTIHYVASHPLLYATYSWRVGRAGKGPVPGVPECSVDGIVSLTPFTFEKEVGVLLGTCPSAAFYAYVYVYARAINGIGRLSQYDASAIIAFALTP
ncbi:Uncharacterised protein [uncultured archaeon]|nr:Uncharacterised protein [uncultured archaeon]